MAVEQEPLASLLIHLSTLHLLAICTTLPIYALDMENSYCKCEDFPIEDRPFVAIWNAPTGGCNVNYSININLRNFDILENPEQTWDGKYVTVFYNAQLGLYPYFTNEEGTNSYNGGMPQLVNLGAHLKKAKEDITKKIPDPHFSGVAVIDWEGWRPTWERNFDSKRIYQSKSVDIVQGKHPDWPMAQLIEQAKEEFEQSARMLMESSIKLARRVRPKGRWGFYGFPDCFGSSNTNYHCSQETKKMNNKLKWLFASSTALYPSIYMYDQQPWNKAFAYGRLEESFRLAAMVSREKKHRLPVFPYFRHLYEGKPLVFDYLTDIDLQNTIGQAADMGAAGVVMWGNRRDENTSPQVCLDLNHYIEATLGPYFESVRREMESCSEVKCSGRGRCVNSRFISSSWVAEEPYLYGQTCKGSPRTFTTNIRHHLTELHHVLHHDHRAKIHNIVEKNNKGKHRPRVKYVMNTKDKEILVKELALLNSTGDERTFRKSRHRNSSKDFVVFMSSADSAVEVNKAPQEHSPFTYGGVTATSGLHYHDNYEESPSFTQTGVKGAPSKVMMCNDSFPGSSCEIMKESPSTFAPGFHFPHLYVVFICVSLGSALLISSAFIMSYYYCNIHKKVAGSANAESGNQGEIEEARNCDNVAEFSRHESSGGR